MKTFTIFIVFGATLLGIQAVTNILFEFTETFNRFISFPIFVIVFHYIMTRLWTLACMVPYLLYSKAGVWKIIFTPIKVFLLFYSFRYFYLVIVHNMSFKEAKQA
jgi:hypothetical protein